MYKLGLRILALSMCAMVALPTGLPLRASSHREAPAITLDPVADNTDLYAFRSTELGSEDSVTLIANFIPLEDPSGGPNFHKFDPEVLYEIMIDNDGDAHEDITYQFQFETQIMNDNTFLTANGPISSLADATYNVRQVYSVTRVTGDRRSGVEEILSTDLTVPPTNIGPATTPSYGTLAQEAVYDLPDGSRVFAGPRDEGFYVDLGAIFDLLQIRKLPGDMGGGVDGTAGKNVHSIALEVPISLLTADGSVPASPDDPNAVIGVWSTASRPQLSIFTIFGKRPEFRQVSRLGSPLVNEVVIPLGDKDKFNRSSPSGDAKFLDYVLDPELAGLLNALFGVAVPEAPRDDLVQVFLTGIPGLTQPPDVVGSEMLRLNMGVEPSESPNRLGVLAGDLAGFPNGRRVGDDVVDIALRAVAGVLVDGFDISPNNQLGDGVDQNDVPYLPDFPYLAAPNSGGAETIMLTATINGAQEAPSVDTPAMGTGTFVIDTAVNTLAFNITFSDLLGTEVAAHIHGFAPPGDNSGVLFGLPPGSPKTGVWYYDESLEAGILGGQTYVNIHTDMSPPGEIRGQIGNAAMTTLFGTLGGDQEVPAVDTPATGTAIFSVDTEANTVTYNITYSGLVGVEVAAHIHGLAPAGDNTGVLFGLLPDSPKTGTWGYDESMEEAILGGQTYINIHSDMYPSGEIRGQMVAP